MASVALAIPHTPWVPERVASLLRLQEGLGILGFSADQVPISRDPWPLFHYREFRERESNSEWSRKLWTWGLETGADYLLQLQDDVIVAPRFWDHLSAMLAAVPDQIIGLEAAHPWGPRLAASGVRWYTTADMLIGVGYVIPHAVLDEFLRWRASSLVEDWQTDEDMLIACFCMATGRRIWHPIPTIIDHNVELASNYGHENHSHRRPSVTWKDLAMYCPMVPVDGTAQEKADLTNGYLSEPGNWSGKWRRSGTPHLGRFYDHTPALCRRIVRGFGEEQFWRAKRDIWRGLVT